MAKKKNQTGLDLMLLLNSTLRQMNNKLSRDIDMEVNDITVEQLSLLIALWKKEGISQQDLGEYVDKDRPSVTRLLDNMERGNLVVRITSEQDRRVRLIYLTKKGKDLQVKLLKVAEAAVKKSLQNIDSEKLSSFVAVAEMIKENILQEQNEDKSKKQISGRGKR
jgi:MarR family transcriptional regulator, organic hydroperoxide resistance regulator